MNKFTKLTALILAVVMAVTMLASCGNQVEKPPVDNPDVSDVTPATEPSVSSDPITSSDPAVTSEPVSSDTEPSTEPTTSATEPTTSDTPATTTEDDGSFTVEDMSATMYATDSVNVRKGPGADYDKIGRFDKNEAVTVTGRASTGWFRVEIDGKTGYVSNAYLTDTKPSAATTTQKTPSSSEDDPDIDIDDDNNTPAPTPSSSVEFGDVIADNCLEYTMSKMKDPKYEIVIREILEGIQNFLPEITVSKLLTEDEAREFQNLILPIIAVEYCYVDTLIGSIGNGMLAKVKVSYNCDTVPEGLEMVSQLRSKTNSILSKVKSSWSDYQKVKYVYDWLVLNSTPDEENIGGPWASSAYGAIVDGRPTCLGYSKATFYMLSKLGYDVAFDIGMGTVAKHIWVKVRLDGKWYCVDTTWGDPVDPTKVDPKYVRYDYFLQTDEYMSQTHADNYDMTFFTEPKANSMNLNWFVVNDCYVEDAGDAERILKNAAKKAADGGNKYEYIRIMCSTVDVYDEVLAEYGSKKGFNSKVLSGITSKYSCDEIWLGTKKAYPGLHQRTLTFRIKK